MTRPSLLIISFSVLESDPRVLKQIRAFSPRYDVVTVGYGPAVDGPIEHISVPLDLSHADLNGRLITLRQYRRAYWALPAMAWARKQLAGRSFDAIFANELETIPLALELGPARGIHLDLHEYTPLINAEHEAWRKRIKPYHEWMARTYAVKASSWSTVSVGLARAYEENFGFRPDLVTNAAPYADLAPVSVGSTIRLVHSGACLRNRQLMTMLDAVELAGAGVTFDLYLTPNDPPYLAEIRERAAGIPGVTVHDPVPYAQLIATLNAYDLGVHLLAPTNFNNTWALPNKLFDYAQARLGVVIGPTPEMAERVSEYGLGVVSDDFTAEALAAKISSLQPEDVAGFKANANTHAHELSAESQVEIWSRRIEALIGPGTR
jgi:hypothetical protein